jgi:ADP-ribose pyrophosphatase YjhB (NUDIX family)
VLLVKRNRDPHKNTWGFPAGFVEYGEHPLDALKRETGQEVGLIVSKARFIKFIQSDEDPRSPGHLVFFYWVTATGRIANNDTDENQKIGWFDIKNPPEIGWPTHKKMMRLLQTKNGINKIKGGKI